MSRINWILNSTLISQPRLRDIFIRLLEIQLNLDRGIDSLMNLPLNRIFDDIGNLKFEILDSITASKRYLSFEHDENDRLLQKLIFLFLRYTQHKYPDMNSWEAFSCESRESQREEIVSEIQMMWLEMQSRKITDEMISDLN
jgi:hypothetical protein